jgi:NADH-quinone oxidoreductase subunit H
MIWLRGAFPRLRVDQLMDFAWKLLLPLALVNIVSASLMVSITQWTGAQWSGVVNLDGFASWQRQLIAVIVTAIINISATYWILSINQRPKEEEWDEELVVAS